MKVKVYLKVVIMCYCLFEMPTSISGKNNKDLNRAKVPLETPSKPNPEKSSSKSKPDESPAKTKPETSSSKSKPDESPAKPKPETSFSKSKPAASDQSASRGDEDAGDGTRYYNFIVDIDRTQ
jgi:hypothetical protein